MPSNANFPVRTVGVIGTGAMGRGIAQIAALAGLNVLLFDTAEGAAARAKDALNDMFDVLLAKKKITSEAAAHAKQILVVVDSLSAFSDSDVIVEAIVEKLEVKQSLFRELESLLKPHAVLATNTSSLSVTAIASVCERPERVAGFHFFNPVPLMKVVEVVAGLRTASDVLGILDGLARRIGHTPVHTKDSPGFIVNHAGRGFGTEALKMLGEGVGSAADIDATLRDVAEFRLGPFELFDLTGLDVSVPVMESVYRQYFEEPRYRPSPLAALRRVAGLLGRKTGEGFYKYPDGRQSVHVHPLAPSERPRSVWVSQDHAIFGERTSELVRSLGAELDIGERPHASSLCIVTPLGDDVTHCLSRQKLDPQRVVGLDCLVPTQRRRVIFLNPLTAEGARREAHGLFASDGTPVTLLRDSVGLASQRVLATIVNIACDMAQQAIASPDDIDRAVTLGLGYPNGPLAWGDKLGGAVLLQILENMLLLTGDPRYRPSPWLRRRAELGVSLLQSDAF
ncbi:MAG: 3-hydroxyacyl-CoA dehydrogenase [Pseudomonadota bacterium]